MIITTNKHQNTFLSLRKPRDIKSSSVFTTQGSRPLLQEYQESEFQPKEGERVLVKNVKGSVKSGEMMAILGTETSGKEDVLRLLAGYFREDEGRCQG